jgi:predicted dienelactone hydrolase
MLSADIAGQIEIATGIPASVISNLPTASRIEADIRPGKARYPVVVMSHGNGGFAIESSSAAERLASKGYVVVGVTHTGNAAFSVLDGEVIPGDPSARVDGITPAPGPSSTFGEFAEYRANVIAQSKTYIRDLQFVLDELQILNATDVRLKGRLDLDHIGVFGFSYGASHAFGALREDSRIDAAAGVDGTIWHEQFKDGSPKPYLVFTGERLTAEEEQAQIETFLGMGYSATEAQQAHDWTRSDILAHMASPNSVRVSIPKARHFNFTDLGIWRDYGFPADDISEEVPPASLLKSYQDYLVAFFEENLKGRYQGILHQASTDPNATVSRSR